MANTTSKQNRRNPNEFMGGGQSLQASLQRRTMQQGSIMLALLLSVLVNVGWGQINDEYRFVQYNVRDNFPTTQLDTTVKLTMDCLAANGYGQWTSSSQTNSPTTSTSSWVPNGWFLLGNRIAESEIQSGGATKATGVVAKGAFHSDSYQPHMKVAANLDGKVRYVWVNPERNGFIIYGLNDKVHGAHPKHIDISFDGFPNPPINRQAVKVPITRFPDATTGTSLVAVEQLWEDEFDIAIDKDNLYIVWASPMTGNNRAIFATAIDLTTSNTINGYPALVRQDRHRPTVAADVRQTGTVGGTFAVGFINQLTGKQNLSFVTNAFSIPIGLTPVFDDPVNLNTTLPINNVTHARVVRSSIQEGAALVTVTGLYFIADNELLFVKLIGNTIVSNAKYVDGIRIQPPAPMIPALGQFPGYQIKDKPIIVFSNPYDAQNATNGTYNQFHVLYQYENAKEIAFPLVDRSPLQIARNFDCGAVNSGATDTRLCMNVNNGMTEDQVETDYNPYTPLGLLPSDPESYVAAVNQMGIHVHWTDFEGVHYYSRDITRTFDENIEENTLVTNNCWVRNGSSHGGNIGATLLPGKTLTLWTDPNWGVVVPGFASLPILKSRPNFYDKAKLIFGGGNVALNIGIPNQVENQNTKLVTLSHFLCEFPVASQSLVINPNAVWEFSAKSSEYELSNADTYSGYKLTGDETPFIANRNNLTIGKGKIFLRGKEVEDVLSPATLNLHGGTEMLILCGTNGASGTIFDADKSIINSLFESSIHPTNMIAASAGSSFYPVDQKNFKNGPEIGKITITGQAKIQNSIVESMHEFPFTSIIAAPSEYTTLTLKPGWQGTVGYQLEAKNTDFRNTTDGIWFNNPSLLKGYESIRLVGNTEEIQYRTILFNECRFSDAPLFVSNPTNGISVLNSDFTATDYLRNWGFINWVEFIRNLDIDYSDILIDGSIFKADVNNDIDYTMLAFDGFSKNHIFALDGIQMNRILITNCDFSLEEGSGEIGRAIFLFNSSAAITSNVIQGTEGSCIQGGILCQGNQGLDPVIQSFAFICDNIIKHCDFGLFTDYWRGYSKLNDISLCYEGHWLQDGVGNGAGMLFCNIYDNKIGVRLTGNAILDLAGIHSSSSNHYAAKNTFSNNNFENDKNPGGQIQFDAGLTTAQLIFALDAPFDDPTKNAQNNFIRTVKTTGTVIKEDNYIYCDDENATVNINSDANLNNVSNNFFRVVTDGVSATELTLTSGTDEPFEGMSFDPSTGLSAASTPGEVFCGAPIGTGGKDNDNKILSLVEQIDQKECSRINSIRGSLAQGGRWQEVYDTGKYFVEHCTGITKTYGAFSDMTGALQDLIHDLDRYTEHFFWLKKVLYYDPDSIYYCADVGEMVQVFKYFDTTNENYRDGKIAILRYILDSAHCDHRQAFFQGILNATYNLMYKQWKDTVTDSVKTPFDPYTPTLDEIDMGFLRGPQSSVTPATHEPRLGELIATRNPFADVLELKYWLAKSGMVRIDVYDLLGRSVYSEGQGYKQEGEYMLSLQSKSWSSGSYYVRLSTPSGEVKTVKVVRE